MKGVFAAALVALAGFEAADACTGMYVGKRASATGATLIGRTEDLSNHLFLKRTVVRQRVENAPGRIARGRFGFAWPLPATTWKYVCTPAVTSNGHGDFAAIGINEKGLALTATVTGYVRRDVLEVEPSVPEGLAEESITGLVAASCASAKEAVDLIAAIVAKAGVREPSIILIADPKEAWWVETYCGHQWAAVRMPEDKVAVFGNEFQIRGFDPADPNFRGSPELVSLPERKGLLVRTADGRPDIFRTYSGRHTDYGHLRTWFGHRAFAPSTAGGYATEAELPQFYTPDRRIGLGDIFELMRSRYEGTEWCPETTGRRDVRVIGDEAQVTCHVLEIRDDGPAELACTAWTTPSAGEHSVFLPISAAVTATDPSFARDSAAGAAPCAYDPEIASARFRRLVALAEVDRRRDGDGIRAYWHDCEKALLAAEPQVRAEALRLYRESPVRAAAFLTARVKALEAAAVADAKALFDALMWERVADNSARRYKQDYEELVLKPYDPRKPFVPDRRALRLLPLAGGTAAPEDR